MSNQHQYLDICRQAMRTRGDLPISLFPDILAAHGLDVDGTCAVSVPGRPNTVLWAGVSEAVADILSDLLASPDVTVTAVNPLLVFGFDGAPMLDLPIAKRLTGQDYKAPHWLPVALDVSEDAS